METEIKEYIIKYDEDIQYKFFEIYDLIMNSVSAHIEVKLWAKLPSFYVGQKFVRVIPFKDHLNIEALDVINHKTELMGYKITPKGMLQIFKNQAVPVEALKMIFKESLT